MTEQHDDPTADPVDDVDQEHTLTPEELADEMSEESFPGSDPPSSWAGAGDPDPRAKDD